MLEKKQLLIIVESLIVGDALGKTILTIARETGIPASQVSRCVSQYSELFTFPEEGKYVAINRNNVPRENWRTCVVRTTKHDKKHKRVIWLVGSLAAMSVVFLSLVGINI